MKLTREQIIAIAWEAKADYDNGVWSLTYDELEAFAALVAAAERESCAKMCEDLDHFGADCIDCAAGIRARGK